MIFHDRREAGRALGRALRAAADLVDPIVLALPRGGVPVAFEVAQELQAPLDVFMVRKLGVPGQEELAMGAVAGNGIVVLNEPVIRAFGIEPSAIDEAVARERQEMERGTALYRGGREPLSLEGRTAILVDDGLATGATMKAAVRAVRPLARRVMAAAPVGAATTCAQLRGEVDGLVCLEESQHFLAVGEFYRHFDPTGDDEVRMLLEQAQQNRHVRDGS
ncbi:MAG TPA: phosphoribosyltransferase family protein [Acidobacteriaceae bacterium]